MADDDRRTQNPLIAKLSQFAPLSNGDVGVLNALCQREERYPAGANIAVEGEAPRSAFVVTRGIACRYRLMQDGRRQILTILIPGDFFDLHGFLLKATDHSVATIGPTRIALPRARGHTGDRAWRAERLRRPAATYECASDTSHSPAAAAMAATESAVARVAGEFLPRYATARRRI